MIGLENVFFFIFEEVFRGGRLGVVLLWGDWGRVENFFFSFLVFFGWRNLWFFLIILGFRWI